MDVTVTPVCDQNTAQKLKSPDDLSGAHLIHRRDFTTWEIWLNAAGISLIDVTSGVVLEDDNFALQMAIDGGGVAMGAMPLIDADVNAGRLIKPFPTVVRSKKSYHLVSTHDGLAARNVAAFRDWVIEMFSPC